MSKRPPPGYQLQTCESLDLALPVPDNWVFWKGQPDQYFASHERITYDNQTLYETGLCLSGIRNISSKSGRTAADTTRGFAESPPEDFQPAGDLGVVESATHITFYRAYTTLAGNVMGMQMGAKAYYLGGIAIPDRDMFCMVTFETPQAEWETYHALGRSMILGIQIS